LQCSTLVSTWPSCGPRGLGAGGPGSPWLSGAAGAALLGGEPTRGEPACMPEACFRRDLGRVSKQKWPQRRSGTAIVPFARTPSVPPNPRVSSDCGLRQTVGMLARSSEPGRSETSRTYSSTHSLWIPVHPLAQNCLLSVGFFRDLVGPHLEVHNTVLYSRKKHLQAHIGRNLGRPFLNKHAARGTRITSDRAEGAL